MIACWTADNTANASVGGYTGSLQAGATFAAGHFGQAFSFDGQDAFVNVDGPASLPVTTAISISAFVNPGISPTAPLGTLFAWRDPFVTEGLLLAIGNDGSVSMQIRTSTMDIYGDGYNTAPGVVTPGQWHQIVASIDT